jgi:4-amino-4-deoxychorismate lyase
VEVSVTGDVVVVWDGARAVQHSLTAPLIRADDGTALHGDGIFETVRTHAGRMFLLEEHLARLEHSAVSLSLMVPPLAAWRELAHVATEIFYAGFTPSLATPGGSAGTGGLDGRLRLAATRGPAGGRPVLYALHKAASATDQLARTHGIEALTLSLGVTAIGRQHAPWLLPNTKHLSYAIPMAALRFAEAAGVDDAVWISADGEVLEGSTSSIVVVAGGRAFTPPPAELGLLAGTTVAALAVLAERAGIPGGIGERRVTVDELRAADEVMLVSSVRGVAPLVSLDGRPVGAGVVGPVTATLRDALEVAVRRGGLD